jgi:hypothetical protein
MLGRLMPSAMASWVQSKLVKRVSKSVLEKKRRRRRKHARRPRRPKRGQQPLPQL